MIPFTATLRARPGTIRLGTPDEPVITFRVQIAEVWDTVRFETPADTSVAAIKRHALGVMLPDAPHESDFVVKLDGWEVLDELGSLKEAGVQSGSTLLIMSRRRHPVR